MRMITTLCLLALCTGALTAKWDGKNKPMDWQPPDNEMIDETDSQPSFQPAHATFYGNFEDKYGATTARPNPMTGKSLASSGVTIAVDPKVIPYGSRVYIPQLNDYSAGGDGVFIAHDTGSDVVKRRAS